MTADIESFKVAKIIQCLKKYRFPLNNEKLLQFEISKSFVDEGIRFEREVTLGVGNIIDFMCDSVGVEVKIKGSKLEIFRQIERYCDAPALTDIILATNVAMGLPENINGKSVWSVNLGRAWL